MKIKDGQICRVLDATWNVTSLMLKMHSNEADVKEAECGLLEGREGANGEKGSGTKRVGAWEIKNCKYLGKKKENMKGKKIK